MIRATVTATLATALLLGAAPTWAEPEISAEEIVDIAITGVGSPYVWGGGCWDPANRSRLGADCSGYVAKCWQVPEASAVTTCSHPYSTYNFYNERTYWDAVDRADLQRADAMVYRADGAGHIVLWVSGDGWGTSEVYEARGTAYGIVHRNRSFSDSYRGRRRHSLIPDGPPPHPLLVPSIEVETIDGQPRDLCTRAGSEGLFDAWVGQGVTERLYVANEGTATATDVVVGIEVGGRFSVDAWEVFDDWDGHSCGDPWCPNDANDHPTNPGHTNPGNSLELHLNSISAGETKMILLDLTALEASFADGVTPEVRFWVRSVQDFYSKDRYDSGFDNVDGLQTFNGGDLRARSRHSLLEDEVCNGDDDDCDGVVDQGFDVGGGCTVGLGACTNEGLRICNGPNATVCDAVAGDPIAENCDNGIDDDCDGQLDDDDESCGGDPDPPPNPEEDAGPSEDAGDLEGDAGPTPDPVQPPPNGLTGPPPGLLGGCSCRAGASPRRQAPLSLLALAGLALALGRLRHAG